MNHFLHIGRIGILAFAACGLGCVPVMVPEHPGVSGRVIDSRTQAPIAGATVKMVGPVRVPASTFLEPERIASGGKTMTPDGGIFSIAEKRRLDWQFVPMCYAPLRYHLKIEHAGYAPAELKLYGDNIVWKKEIAQLGIVALDPLGDDSMKDAK